MKYLKNKIRLDEYLVEKEYFENIDVAKRNIMAGNIIINEMKKEKPGEIINREKIRTIRIKDKSIPYVSRGGIKLEKAIEVFNINLENKIVLDIGASTGGFTDCCLKNGAKFVYAVDVGTNQLDWRLRNNKNVKSIENKHINDLKIEDIDNIYPDIIVMDISFISIKKVLLSLKKFMKEYSIGIFLIKPQFEVEKSFLDKGILEDIDKHKKILLDIVDFFEKEELYLEKIIPSPIRGNKGNIEYLTKFSLNESYKIKDIEKELDLMIKIIN